MQERLDKIVIGSDSRIGSALVHSYKNKNISVWQTSRKLEKVKDQIIYLDLSNETSEWVLPSKNIKIAFFCAAVTSIEYCKNEPEISAQINVINTLLLARRLLDAGIFIIYISSNAVFDGTKSHSNSDDSKNPQTNYGRQKVEVEEELLNMGKKVAIVRFGKVISPDMPLILNWIGALKNGKSIHTFSDMVMAPVSLEFAVNLLIKVAESRTEGVIQASANNDITYTAAGAYLAEKLGANKSLVKGISYKEANISFSPKYTTLDATKLNELNLFAPGPFEAFNQFIYEHNQA